MKHFTFRFLEKKEWLFPQWLNMRLLDRDHKSLSKTLLGRVVNPALSTGPVVRDDPAWAFVLLQYNHHELTQECILSIRHIKGHGRISIVVVDNASTDGSVEVIARLAEEDESIHLIRMNENTGYARGNNAGYLYAKEKLGADFIFCVNNDVVFPDVGILHLIEEEYRQSVFSILGPDIVVPRAGNIHQNPMRYHLKTEEDATRALSRSEKRLNDIEAGGPVYPPPEIMGSRRRSPRREGFIVLHGAAYVFSPRFLSSFDAPFDERTFLYGEEDILCLRALAAGHKLVYSPKVVVEHHAKASTGDAAGYREYWLFRLRNTIQSGYVYLDALRAPLGGKAQR